MNANLEALIESLLTASRRKLKLLLTEIVKIDLASATECWAPRDQGRPSPTDPFSSLWQIARQFSEAADDPSDVSDRALVRRLWDEVKLIAIAEQDFERAAAIRDRQDWIRRYRNAAWMVRQIRMACDGIVCEIQPMEPPPKTVRLLTAARADRPNLVARLIQEIRPTGLGDISIDPRWRTSDVLGLARAIYDDRAFERMPILADALMDAGCENEEIIGHCRGEGPHVRGCWVVDLVLDKK
jgi:hypothetical protein